MEVAIRPAVASDAAFLEEMLVEAAYWRPGDPPGSVEDIKRQPSLAHYTEGWPLPGDLGVVAEAGQPIGAAWLRFFPAEDPGEAFIGVDIPEMAIGVARNWRGRGLGTRLLTALIDSARVAGLKTLSLSVEPDNEARRLYERLGFREVGQGDGIVIMIMTL